jgi:hypothetical protein
LKFTLFGNYRALSILFYAGNQLTELINWSSAIAFTAVNLLIPFALYRAQHLLTTRALQEIDQYKLIQTGTD